MEILIKVRYVSIVLLIQLYLQPIKHYNNLNSVDMYLDSKKKKDIFKKYGKGESDTGTSEGQIALFSHRIKHLTSHLKSNKKDYNTQRSLIRLVGKRRDQLDYLKNKDIERYREIIKKLDIRR